MGEKAVRAAALEYARFGFRVVPLRGKSPAILGAGWPSLATRNPEVISGWWTRWSDANVGVLPDRICLAIDVDPRNGGDGSLADLERRLGPLPTTPRYVTGGEDDGWRLLFAHPGTSLTFPGARGLEFRDGAQQIVAPPSIHPATGRPYEWEITLDEMPLAQLPRPWIAAARAPRTYQRHPRPAGGDPLLAIPAVEYIARLSGRRPDARGYVRCPFHKDGRERRPDLKPYGTSWACFGCAGLGPSGKLGGTIYQFAACLWDYPLPLRGDAFTLVRRRLLREFFT